MDNPASPEYNLPQRVEGFAQYLSEQAHHYRRSAVAVNWNSEPNLQELPESLFSVFALFFFALKMWKALVLASKLKKGLKIRICKNSLKDLLGC